jgi:hypothetical protein
MSDRIAKPQPREHLVCLIKKVNGHTCYKPAKWFISTRIQKLFACGTHAQGWYPQVRHPATDQVLIDMANFYPAPED